MSSTSKRLRLVNFSVQNVVRTKIPMRLFDKVNHFHPYVENVELLSEQNIGIGAERICNFYDGSSIHDTVVGYEEGKWMKVKIKELPSPVKSSHAYLRISQPENYHVNAEMEILFDTKWGILGSIMAKLAMKRQFRKLVNNVLTGLKDHIETGQFIGKGGKPISQETLAAQEGKILIKQTI